ncbi:N-acetylmuramoyl-L-alanine amidase, partial [Clostridium collagenovorans DSM 3089]
LGLSRPDVDRVYPGYKNGKTSGYNYVINKNNIYQGNHRVTVEVIANDGEVQTSTTYFKMKKLNLRLQIDNPYNKQVVNKGEKMLVRGWTLSDSTVEKVEIYVNNKLIMNAQHGLDREDVAAAYPEYNYNVASKSGYSCMVDTTGLLTGKNIVAVKVYNKDSTTIMGSKEFIVGKTIIIDAGHGGSDPGASSVIDGVTYREEEVNLKVAETLKEKLENKGFMVIMTRNANNQSVSLQDRVTIANNSKADLFISIHHDSFTNSSANGVTSFYSTWKPGLDNEGVLSNTDGKYDITPCIEAVKSQVMGAEIVNAMSSVGYSNRGNKDRELYVTSRTNMPALLLECGFITNKSDISKITSNEKRNEMAEKISTIIEKNLYGN